MKKSSAQKVESPSQLIDARIKELGDWRGKTLSRLRALIKKADPEVVEEWKWRKPSRLTQSDESDITDVKVIKAPDLPKSERTLGTIACQESRDRLST